MDPGDVLSIFLRGAIGSGGRKRARKVSKYVTGHKGFLTTSTLLTAAGLAWGVYDSMKGSGAAQGLAGSPTMPGTGPSFGNVPSSTGGAATTNAPLPPLPATPPPMIDEVLRLVRLAVSAARADGTLAPQERERILQHARDAGLESVVERELDSPHSMTSIVAGVTDAQRKQDLYVLAFSIVRADDSVNGAERIYLAQLAYQLGLDAATVSHLEQQTVQGIEKQTI